SGCGGRRSGDCGLGEWLARGRAWAPIRLVVGAGLCLGSYPLSCGGGLGGGVCFSSGKNNSLRSDIFFPARKTHPTSRRQNLFGNSWVGLLGSLADLLTDECALAVMCHHLV